MDIKEYLVTRDNVHPPRKGRAFWRRWREEVAFWSPLTKTCRWGEGVGWRKASPHSWQSWLHPGKRLASGQGPHGTELDPASWHWICASEMQDYKGREWSIWDEKSPRNPAEWNAVSASVPGVLAQVAPQIQSLVSSWSPAKWNWPTSLSVSLPQFETPWQQGPPRLVPGLHLGVRTSHSTW